MARMRFPVGRSRPRTIVGAITSDDRKPDHLGDIPSIPAEPDAPVWSLASWPFPDLSREPEGDVDA